MLKELCMLNGTSGREHSVRDFIISKIPADCEYTVDRLGNIICEKKGRNRAKNKVMLYAHMDEVGFIITYITDDGMLKFSTVGGIDERVIFGRSVTLQSGVHGVIGSKAFHQLSSEEREKVPPVDELYIDIGADSKKEAQKYVNLGDSIVNVAAWLLGPAFGAAAAGIGSAAADIISGYVVYAPATLIIKAAMAVVSFYVFKTVNTKFSSLPSRIAAAVSAEVVMMAGYTVFEAIMYHSMSAAVLGLPGNIVQGALGAAVSVAVYELVIKRVPHFQK